MWAKACHRCPLQHLQIAIRIAEGRERVLPDLFIDGDRLAGTVVDEVHLRKTEQDRDVTLHLETRLDARPDHLIWRYAIHRLAPRTHEFDTPARSNKGLETVRAQIGEQLQHRLVNQFGIWPLETRVTRGCEPV